MPRELIVYCDESDISGPHFSNFYGGLLVERSDLPEVEDRIAEVRGRVGLTGEAKWQKISRDYAGRYIALIDEVFALAGEGKLKLRLMFTQNYFSPARLTPEQRDNGFFLLYYQFVKHAFGLRFAGDATSRTRLRLMFDQLPDTLEKRASFKGYLAGLAKSQGFRDARIDLAAGDIAEVDSRRHALLQCVDVVLGAMQFRLNDKHRARPDGQRVRGQRTIAKEAVYRHVLKRIRLLQPNFNPGISTGLRGDPANAWRMAYRHWLFRPENAIKRPEFAKRRKKRPRVR